MKLRELFLELGVAVDNKELETFDRGLQKIKSSMKDVASKAAMFAGVLTGAVAGLGALANKESEFAEEVARTAKAFGISTDAYQGLRFAFLSLNASSDDLADALASINNTVYKARDGSTEYVRALGLLGLTWEDLINLPVDQKLYAIRDAVRSLGDADQAMAGLRPILGGDLARRLAPGFADTGGAMEKFVHTAQKAGLIIEEDLIQKGAEARLIFRELGAIFSGITRRIGISVAPAFARLGMVIQRVFSHNVKIGQDLLGRFVTFFEKQMKKVEVAIKDVDNFVQLRFGGWEKLFTTLGAVITAFAAGSLGVSLYGALVGIKMVLVGITKAILVSSAILFAKLLLLAAVVLMVALALEDMWIASKGGESWFGKLKAQGDKLSGTMRALVGFIDWMIDGVRWLAMAMGKLWDETKRVWTLIAGTESFDAFIALLYALAVGIGVLVLAFAALLLLLLLGLGALLYTIFEGYDLLVKHWDEMWDFMADKAQEVIDDIKQNLKDMFNPFKGGIGQIIIDTSAAAEKRRVEQQQRAELTGPRGSRITDLSFMIARKLFGRGASSAPSVNVGDINVEVNVPAGTAVDEAVGQSIGDTIQEVTWADNMTSMSRGY